MLSDISNFVKLHTDKWKPVKYKCYQKKTPKNVVYFFKINFNELDFGEKKLISERKSLKIYFECIFNNR